MLLRVVSCNKWLYKFCVTISCHDQMYLPKSPFFTKSLAGASRLVLIMSVPVYHKLFSPPFPSSLLLLLTHFSQTNNSNSNKQSTFSFPFLKSPYQISFPAKNATHAHTPCTPNRFKQPKYPLPAPTTDTTQITNYSQKIGPCKVTNQSSPVGTEARRFSTPRRSPAMCKPVSALCDA